MSALLAFNYEADFETNCQEMEQAIKQVQTAEITTAVRTVQIDGIDVSEGDIIGLVNGKLVTAGREMKPSCARRYSACRPRSRRSSRSTTAPRSTVRRRTRSRSESKSGIQARRLRLSRAASPITPTLFQPSRRKPSAAMGGTRDSTRGRRQHGGYAV